MKNEVLAIIPARGGSKGLLRKNVKLLLGKPLIVHTIEHALNAKKVTRVSVTTDDQEIGQIATENGAEVVWRPRELSDDFASSEQALSHSLKFYEEQEHYEPEIVVFLQCTSPIRNNYDIDRAIEYFTKAGADSLLSVVDYHGFVWEKQNGNVVSSNYDFRQRARRQELDKQYLENGSIYIFRPWVLKKYNNRLGGKIELYEMDDATGFEIDSELDFTVVEAVLKYEQGKKVKELL